MAIFCKILMQQKRQVPLNLPELYIIFNSILNQSKGLRFSTQKQAVAKKAKAKVIFVKQCRRFNITHFLCPFLIFLYDIVSKLFIYYSLFTYLSRLFSIFVLFFILSLPKLQHNNRHIVGIFALQSLCHINYSVGKLLCRHLSVRLLHR